MVTEGSRASYEDDNVGDHDTKKNGTRHTSGYGCRFAATAAARDRAACANLLPLAVFSRRPALLLLIGR